MFYLYFIQSFRNGKYYVGTTEKEPTTRLREHNAGSNAWTSQNGLFRLVYFESYCCKQDLLHREKFYKSGFGRKIKNIILQAAK